MHAPFLLAQLSDLHIKAGGRLSYGVVDTLGALRLAVDRLNALQPRPDALVITGDLVDFGTPEEYATLREVLAELAMPSSSSPAITTTAPPCAPPSPITPICRPRAPWTGSRTSARCG